MRLANKIAVVTGGGAGLGRAVAERFAREGACVVIAEQSQQRGMETEAAIIESGSEALFIHTDVSQEEQVREMVSKVRSHYGHVDILHNNAAILMHEAERPVHELPVEVWDKAFEVNARGTFLVSKYILPLMLQNNRGSIVIVGSPTAINGSGASVPAYSASKGALHGLARSMTIQYAPHAIRVNVIVPGTMDTPMNASVLNGDRRHFLDRIPLGRLGRAEDVTGLSVFLASDESDYCTGGTYMADGGLTAY